MYIVGEAGHEQINKYIMPMEETGVAYERCSGEEVMERCPGLIQFPGGHQGFYEGDSGILAADKAVQTMQVCFSFALKIVPLSTAVISFFAGIV